MVYCCSHHGILCLIVVLLYNSLFPFTLCNHFQRHMLKKARCLNLIFFLIVFLDHTYLQRGQITRAYIYLTDENFELFLITSLILVGHPEPEKKFCWHF